MTWLAGTLPAPFWMANASTLWMLSRHILCQFVHEPLSLPVASTSWLWYWMAASYTATCIGLAHTASGWTFILSANDRTTSWSRVVLPPTSWMPMLWNVSSLALKAFLEVCGEPTAIFILLLLTCVGASALASGRWRAATASDNERTKLAFWDWLCSRSCSNPFIVPCMKALCLERDKKLSLVLEFRRFWLRISFRS